MAKYIRTEEGYKTLEEIGAVTAYTEFKRYKLIEKQSVSVPEDGYKELVTETVMPTKGATYFVTLNRTQYKCVAWWNHNWECIVIGNGSLADMEGMGEDVPFVIDFYCNEDNYTYAYLNADGGEYTILIEGLEPIHKLDKKYLPDSVINSIDNAQTMAETAQAMAETAQTMAEQKSDWNADEDAAGHVLNRTHWSETVYGEVLPPTTFNAGGSNPAQLPLTVLEAGKTYTVVYDGTTYTCEAKDGEVDGVYIIGVGNDMLFGGEQTGEPFGMAYAPDNNFTGIIPLTDTESVHSVQITGEKTVYHKIPREYLYSKRIEFTLGGEDAPGYWYAHTTADVRDIINDAENGVFQYATITFPMEMDGRTDDIHLTMPLASHETFTRDDGITVHRVQFECEIELDKRYIFVTSIEAYPEAGLSISGLTKKVADSVDGGAGIDVTAEVGQTIVVKSVDENGKPTEWEAADYYAGAWKHICDITTTEQVDAGIVVTENSEGVPLTELKYNEIWIMAKMVGVDTNTHNWWACKVHHVRDVGENVMSYADLSQSGGTTGTKYISLYAFIRGGKVYKTNGAGIDPYDIDGGNSAWMDNYLDKYTADHFVSVEMCADSSRIIGADTEIRILGRRV